MTELKRLTRPRDERMLAGVCAGVARYLNIDPTLVRIGTVVLALVTAVVPFVVGYVIAWVLMPESDAEPSWSAATDRP